MSNSHGDLFTEIGKLVLAANSGQAIDLNGTVKDLVERYRNLGMTEETMMKVVTRSIGAISYSMARTNSGLQERLEALRESGTAPSNGTTPAPAEANGGKKLAKRDEKLEAEAPSAAPVAKQAVSSGRRSRRASTKSSGEPSAKSPFPSGVRLALIP
jgi:hypothetical protein